MKQGQYFVGDEIGESGRVSTAITHFNDATKIGITASGREYELVGEHGYSSDGEYCWQAYKRINNLTELDNPVEIEVDNA